MQLIRYDPMRDLRGMERNLDKFWEDAWGLLPTSIEAVAMDMYEENGKLIAQVNLPNFKKDEVKVTTDRGVLEVTAEHKEKEEEKGKRRYLLRESSNEYWRRVALPEGVNADKAQASFKDGMLRVSMPITAQKKTKSVTVK